MTDYGHDPELPFAYVSPTQVYARFTIREDAEIWRERLGVGEVIDTTPKPKIPEDAEFIFIDDYDQSVFARREGIVDGEMLWLTFGDFITEEELIEDFIGDAEVTVLVRKDES